MSSLQQHLADTAAHLNAQLCELNELRDRARKALLSKSPQPEQWNGPGATSRSSPEVDREPVLGQHWSAGHSR
jgi:hypothetical protein